MSSLPLAAFLRDHRAMHLTDVEQPIPVSLLERLKFGQRLALVKEGQVVGAVVTLDDLHLLDLTDHGLTVVEDVSL